MAGVTTANCNSFKLEALRGVHLDSDTYKIALIKHAPSGTFDKTTENYRSLGKDEVSANGYTAGGLVLSNGKWALNGDTASICWDDAVWPPGTMSADGALIYNASKGNRAVQVIAFADTSEIPVRSTNANFLVELHSEQVRIK